jgi:LuxR family maltose regulon positive regulatory protein
MNLQLKEARARFPASSLGIWDAFHIAEARSLAAHGDVDEAVASLNEKSQTATDQERFGSAISLRALSLRLSEGAGLINSKARHALIDEAAPLGLGKSIADIFAAPVQDGYLPRVADTSDKLEPSKNLLNLTPREISVLELMRRGLSNNEIADSLTINLNTVKSHVKNIFEKLQVKSRTQAVLKTMDV